MNNLKIRSNLLNNNCWITAHRAANLAVWLLALNAPMTLSHAAEPLKTIELIFNNQMAMTDMDKLQAALQAQGVTVSSYNLDAAKALSESLSQASRPTRNTPSVSCWNGCTPKVLPHSKGATKPLTRGL